MYTRIELNRFILEKKKYVFVCLIMKNIKKFPASHLANALDYFTHRSFHIVSTTYLMV